MLRLCRADFDANLDLEFPTKEGQIQNRGDFSYHQPSCDWLRVGLNVKGRYENDDWMGTSGGHGEWVVAYHGSKSLAGDNCNYILFLRRRLLLSHLFQKFATFGDVIITY